MTFLLDSRSGSCDLARHEPVRSLLYPCPSCAGTGQHPESTPRSPAPCRGTGRRLSLITTPQGQGGPDVLICGQGPSSSLLIAVEVKSLRDLLQSAATGRLQAEGDGQLQIMLTNYDQSWLLWYGQIRHGDNGYLEEPGGRGDNGRCLWRPFTHNNSKDGRPVKNEFLEQMLFAIAAMGVHVHHVHSLKHAAQWLGSLYKYWTKPYSDHTFTRTFASAPRFPKSIEGVSQQELERARRVFDRYPGLGMEKSLAAAHHFPSVQAMANADEKEWKRVSGIGPVIAAAVVKAFRS